MQSIIYKIGAAITSMGAVLLVLLLTITANVFFSHTVFYETLPNSMVGWEKSLAAYVISVSYELTLLVVVCNTELLVSKRLPILLAICSGVLILFFIRAFEPDLSVVEYCKRWFIGSLVTFMNITFSSLFYRKWCQSNHQRDQSVLINQLTASLAERDSELKSSKLRINQLDSRILQASDYIIELEAFKKTEISKLVCPHCGVRQDSVYKLAAHKSICAHNPKHEAKMSIEGVSQL